MGKLELELEQVCSTCMSLGFLAEWCDLERDREVVGKLAYY